MQISIFNNPFSLAACLLVTLALPQASASEQGEAIPFSELGARAEQEANGEGVSLVATHTGAELRTRFQHLVGEVNERGLWIRSTAPGEESRTPFQFVHPLN